jgi:hypothetical protein
MSDVEGSSRQPCRRTVGTSWYAPHDFSPPAIDARSSAHSCVSYLVKHTDGRLSVKGAHTSLRDIVITLGDSNGDVEQER